MNEKLIKEYTNKGLIFFTDDESEAIIRGWRKFFYECIHINENSMKTSIKTIYTADTDCFNALLSKWNRIGRLQSSSDYDMYIYVEVIQV